MSGLSPSTPAYIGLLALDADEFLPKRRRADLLATAAEKGPERTPGTGDFKARNLADPANPLFWPGDHFSGKPIPRGSTSSWSFAMPAYHLGQNTFQPLEYADGPDPSPFAVPAAGAGAGTLSPGKYHPGLGYVVAPGGHVGQFGAALPPVQGPPAAVPPPTPVTLSDRKNLDGDFASANVHHAHYGKTLPEGVIAAILASTHHGKKDKIAVLSGGPLVADWLGPNAPDMSRYMFDIDLENGANPIPSRARKAGLHTAFRVRRWGEVCNPYLDDKDIYAIALNGTDAPISGIHANLFGPGFLFTHFHDDDALMSAEMSGPLIPSCASGENNHTVFGSKDGNVIAGAISTSAYYRFRKQLVHVPPAPPASDPEDPGTQSVDSARPGARSIKGCISGPLEFLDVQYEEPNKGHTPWKTERRWDPGHPHTFHCGRRKGMWREETWIDLAKTPACNPTKEYLQVGEDADGNPRRTFMRQGLFFPRGLGLISNGIRFQPRAGLRAGRPR